MWGLGKPSAASGAAREDGLAVYQRAPDPAFPVVCFDEGRKELRGEVHDPLPPAPGRPARMDAEYSRHGGASLLLWCAPHLGLRAVSVTARRTSQDWARAMRALVDEPRFRDAERIVVVRDHRNTHTAAALYETFAPAEALRIWERLEVHDPPKHGSWLTIAECELSALGRQCLERRIADQATLTTEVAAWVDARNVERVTVDWPFTTEDARITLNHLYPVLRPIAT